MTKVTATPTKPLVERVAAILGNDEQRPSSVFADLISEIDSAIDAADQAGLEARAAMADPKIIDHGARGRAEDAEGLAHKLRNGLQALRGDKPDNQQPLATPPQEARGGSNGRRRID
jgi:hypothetical protein